MRVCLDTEEYGNKARQSNGRRHVPLSAACANEKLAVHKLGIEAHAYAHYTSLLCFALLHFALLKYIIVDAIF